MTSDERIASDQADAQAKADALISAFAGKRARLKVQSEDASLEYAGRVPRTAELTGWSAAERFGTACILARPGSHDPANPISPQVHYLKLIDGNWCIVRLRLQDSEPLEIRRISSGEIRVTIEALDDG